MLIHILPGLIMFAITLAFVTLFFIPVTAFKQKNELIRFYWVGIWVFLAMIAAFSGGSETLTLFKYDVGNFPTTLLTSLTICFVLFRQPKPHLMAPHSRALLEQHWPLA